MGLTTTMTVMDMVQIEHMPPFLTSRFVKNLGRVVKPFNDLVSRTIPNLVNLQEYALSLGGPNFGHSETIFGPMWLPDKAQFRLRRFSVDTNLTPPMVKFLASQPNIIELFAPYFISQRGSLPNDALPQLRSIVTNATMAAALVPRRPVRRVAVRETGGQKERATAAIMACLPALAKASVSVKQFDVSLFDTASITDRLMEPLATFLPRLESITIRRHPGWYPHEVRRTSDVCWHTSSPIAA